MTLASSWLDLVIGVDIHNELVPTPGGPVPTPIPQPYIGLIGDPKGMPFAYRCNAATSLVMGGGVPPPGVVLVNGFPATTTGEVAYNTPLLPHLPMPPGVAYVKPPSGDASFPLGVLKVTFGGNSAIRLGDLARSCGDPVPLPNSRVVVIPKGAPVMVLGTPGIDVASAVEKWAMGKLIRTAWSKVSPLARSAPQLSGPRLRNLSSKVTCFIP